MTPWSTSVDQTQPLKTLQPTTHTAEKKCLESAHVSRPLSQGRQRACLWTGEDVKEAREDPVSATVKKSTGRVYVQEGGVNLTGDHVHEEPAGATVRAGAWCVIKPGQLQTSASSALHCAMKKHQSALKQPLVFHTFFLLTKEIKWPFVLIQTASLFESTE